MVSPFVSVFSNPRKSSRFFAVLVSSAAVSAFLFGGTVFDASAESVPFEYRDASGSVQTGALSVSDVPAGEWVSVDGGANLTAYLSDIRAELGYLCILLTIAGMYALGRDWIGE